MLLVLPARPRRAWLRAFGIAAALWVGLAIAVLAPLDGWGRGMAALAVAVLGSAVAVGRPEALSTLYRPWNKVARGYARGVQTVLLVLCYGVVAVVGLAGSSLRLRRPAPGESLWYPKETLAVEAYRSQDEGPNAAPGRSAWTTLPAWAVRTRNGWAVVLVPLLLLVTALDRREHRDYPAGIYTLF